MGNIFISIKKIDGDYKKVYTYDTADFAHAIYGGTLLGKPAVIIGHRKGERNLLLFTWEQEKGQYQVEILDRDCGPANVFKYERGTEEVLILRTVRSMKLQCIRLKSRWGGNAKCWNS